jgi:hypothetical protein
MKVKVFEHTMYTPLDYIVSLELDDDTYNDLLILEKKIREMKDRGLIEPKEVRLLLGISRGYSFEEVGDRLGLDRKTVRLKFRKLCDSIAYYIGGVYTNEGFVEYLSEKHNLNSEQVKALNEIIEQNRRILN